MTDLEKKKKKIRFEVHKYSADVESTEIDF